MTDSCPYCGEELIDLYEYFDYNAGDEDENEGECPNCNKPIRIIMHLDVEYEITKVE